MKILLDTNILISSDGFSIVPPTLQQLLVLVKENDIQLYVHPASMADIQNDKDEKRKVVMLSKIKSYPMITDPPRPSREFLDLVGGVSSDNDMRDIQFLYAVEKSAASILLTEDKGILRRGIRAGLSDKVFTTESLLGYLKKLYERKYPPTLLTLKRGKAYSLDASDPFFSSLKEEYGESDFIAWLKKVSEAQRDCWLYAEEGKLKALMIIKEEMDSLRLVEKTISPGKRLKICLFKVDKSGFRLGEQFLKIAFEYCVKNGIFELYLTHFTKEDDILVELIKQYGFVLEGRNAQRPEEDVYFKRMVGAEPGENPLSVATIFYPSFKDNSGMRKFIIPIQPKFHDRLFPEFEASQPLRQRSIVEFVGVHKIMSTQDIPGNTIKKAYLCNSPVTRVSSGSLILFYRSKDKVLASVGVVEKVLSSQNPNEIVEFVGNRTVYSYPEIVEMTKKKTPTLCILFKHHLYLRPPTMYNQLLAEEILKGPPQSIVELDHPEYLKIKKFGGIDARFAVN